MVEKKVQDLSRTTRQELLTIFDGIFTAEELDWLITQQNGLIRERITQ
jgi:hypothetical protein